MKKKVPFRILVELDKLKEFSNLYTYRENKECILHLIDKDITSDFFFLVNRQSSDKNGVHYLVECKPKNDIDISINSFWATPDDIGNFLKIWLDSINKYNSMNSIFDDPILKANQERFEEEFKILDDDADTSSFSWSQQIAIDEYIAKTIQRISEFKEGKTESEIVQLDEIINDFKKVQQNLTKETKNEVVKGLAKGWAKIQKFGMELIKKFIIDVSVDYIKKVMIGEVPPPLN
jgi:hypothetical protein